MPRRWQEELDRAIDSRFDAIVELRRWLHRNPEPSGEERETSLHLYQLLGNEKYDVRMGHEGRGVVADGHGAADARRIALRADLDALRIHDTKQVPYRSCRAGVMHACGHDAHTAIVYGVLAALNQLQADGALPWEVPLRGIFQPAEETSQGAREMIRVGALDGVAAILACHMDPSRPVGHVGLRSGVLTAACDEFVVRVVGRGGHGARPHEANDPIAAAAQLINALYLLIPRVTDSQDAVVVTVGQIRGGDNANVIPESVELRGTVRSLEADVRTRTVAHIRRLADGVSRTSDTLIEVDFITSCSSVRNDPRLTLLLRQAALEVVGEGGIDEILRPSMGSEDFAFYLDQVAGAMARIGCAGHSTGSLPLHSPAFDIDEQALRVATRLLARAAVLAASPRVGVRQRTAIETE